MYYHKRKRYSNLRLNKSKIINEKPTFCGSLDDGTTAFMKWLCSDNKNSLDNRLIVKDFLEDKYAVFYDRDLEKHIVVINRDGIPFCKNCDTDDCGHVGFAICLKQHCNRNGTIDL